MNRWIILLMLVSGCAMAPSKEAQEIVAVEDSYVTFPSNGCTSMGHTFGTSLIVSLNWATGKYNAESEALDHAAQLHATHIVWRSHVLNHMSGQSVMGEAYRCNT